MQPSLSYPPPPPRSSSPAGGGGSAPSPGTYNTRRTATVPTTTRRRREKLLASRCQQPAGPPLLLLLMSKLSRSLPFRSQARHVHTTWDRSIRHNALRPPQKTEESTQCWQETTQSTLPCLRPLAAFPGRGGCARSPQLKTHCVPAAPSRISPGPQILTGVRVPSGSPLLATRGQRGGGRHGGAAAPSNVSHYFCMSFLDPSAASSSIVASADMTRGTLGGGGKGRTEN